jgi:hypothetical protein
VTTHQSKINIHAGSGCVFEKNEPYSLSSESGAILLIVESQELTAHARAISSPQRIEGATWPSDEGGGRAAGMRTDDPASAYEPAFDLEAIVV